MTKEPTLLGYPPSVLLSTLEALNSVLDMPPDKCVSYALQHTLLIGLEPQQLSERLMVLRGAVRVSKGEAVKLAQMKPELLLVSHG